ncbi:MAG: hypothetical protein MR471_07000, partial [Clostridia bacterium]|nr:hypothetical protein [Clostridia bacterium]
VDVRKNLFYACAEKNWPLIGLEALGMSLEDIFITIVDTTSEDDKKKGSRRGSKKVGRETTEDAVAAAMIENAKEKDQE